MANDIRPRSGRLTTAEREQYAQDYRWFARKVSRQVLSGSGRGRDLLRRDPEALDATAAAGLWRAVRDWERARGVRFTTFLAQCCWSEAKRYTHGHRTINVVGRERTRALPPDDLTPALARADNGPAAVEAADLLDHLVRPLTPQARDVVRRLASGHRSFLVARDLGLSKSRISALLAEVRPEIARRLAAVEAAA